MLRNQNITVLFAALISGCAGMVHKAKSTSLVLMNGDTCVDVVSLQFEHSAASLNVAGNLRYLVGAKSVDWWHPSLDIYVLYFDQNGRKLESPPGHLQFFLSDDFLMMRVRSEPVQGVIKDVPLGAAFVTFVSTPVQGKNYQRQNLELIQLPGT